jgi:hypothetical protein
VGRGTEKVGRRGSCRAETTESSQWRMAIGKWFFWRAVLLHCRKILGALGDAPSRILRRMNSALRKIRHQPLAGDSGMGRKIVKGSLLHLLHPALSTLHLYTPLHLCTLARLHTYTHILPDLPNCRLHDLPISFGLSKPRLPNSLRPASHAPRPDRL